MPHCLLTCIDYYGLIILTDLPSGYVEMGYEPVMYLGPDTAAIAKVIPEFEGRKCCDVFSGSGVLGLVASLRFEEVVCVDVGGRAREYGVFNGGFNGRENVVFKEEGERERERERCFVFSERDVFFFF